MSEEKISVKDVAKVQLKETLKAGGKVWAKGTVFDRKDGAFPKAIVEEIVVHLAGTSNVIGVLMTAADIDEENKKLHDAEVARQDAITAQRVAEKELADRISAVGDLEKQNEELTATNGVLLEQVDAFKSSDIMLQGNIETLKSEIVDLKKKVSDLEVKLKKAKS